MSSFANDAFTDAAGTALPSHTPDSGGSWTRHPSYAGTAVIGGSAAANALRSNVTAPSLTPSVYYHSAVPAGADYDVVADVKANAYSSQTAGVVARLDTTANTFYGARYNGALDGWELYKCVAGSLTSLGSSVSSPLAGGTRTLRLSLLGTSLSVWVDGASVIARTDATIAAAGRAGVWFVGPGSDAHSLDLDNWSADTPSFVEPASGGLRQGGSAVPTATYAATAAGGMRQGGSSAPAVACHPAHAGGFALGGSAPRAKAYTFAASGGMPLGGRAGPAFAFRPGPAGGERLGGSPTARAAYATPAAGGLRQGGELLDVAVFIPGHSGGVRHGGAASVVGHVVYSASASGGLGLGGAATTRSTWTLPASGGVRYGGDKLPRDYRSDGAGGLRFGGESTLASSAGAHYVESPSGGMRFGAHAEDTWPGLHYRVYKNAGDGGGIDYDSFIYQTYGLTYTYGPLAFPGVWKFGVRAINDYGEERNIDCVVRVQLDGLGGDVSAIPAAPTGLHVLPIPGGLRLLWLYPAPRPGRTPRGFRAYATAGVSISYAAAAATVPYRPLQVRYAADVTGLAPGPCVVAVRAYNATGDDGNLATVAAVVDDAAPGVVDGLAAVAVAEDAI